LSAALDRQATLVAEGRRIGDLAMVRWATECLEWTRRHTNLLIEVDPGGIIR
jgi:hypothetical protein